MQITNCEKTSLLQKPPLIFKDLLVFENILSMFETGIKCCESDFMDGFITFSYFGVFFAFKQKKIVFKRFNILCILHAGIHSIKSYTMPSKYF